MQHPMKSFGCLKSALRIMFIFFNLLLSFYDLVLSRVGHKISSWCIVIIVWRVCLDTIVRLLPYNLVVTSSSCGNDLCADSCGCILPITAPSMLGVSCIGLSFYCDLCFVLAVSTLSYSI